MSGSLPDEICLLISLQSMDVDGIHLHGTIPADIGNMQSLQYLDLSVNDLVGHIPLSFGRLPLIALDLADNGFDGPISTWIGSLTSLIQMHGDYNHFTGSIPSSIGGLQSLTWMSFTVNNLGGTLPTEIGSLRQLLALNLQDNLFEGSIPPSIVNLTAIEALTLNNNGFDGSIPQGINALGKLFLLDLDNNHLQGQIPFDMASASTAADSLLMELSLGLNALTGTFPFSLSYLPQLLALELQDNHLSGDLSFFPVAANSLLNYINISGNHFAGNMLGLANHLALDTLDLGFNQITGTIPSFIHWPRLQYFFVQHNQLSGSIEHLFDPIASDFLQNVDVSFNKLTGLLPQKVVWSPRSLKFSPFGFSSFAAVSNCFTGAIPDSLCSIITLTSLALDGLSTASHCRMPILHLFDSYALPYNAVHGTIPACLFNMSALTTLHLSGNDLDGTIPVSSSQGVLSDLSLSHNRLTGTVPRALQGGDHWTNLDLSFNKLSGSLSEGGDSYSANASIALDINRLSGGIPSIYYDVSDVDMLRGNLFDCQTKAMASDVPDGDPYKDQYDCGSDTIDAAYYVWLAMLVVLAAIIAGLLVWSKQSASVQAYNEIPLLEFPVPSSNESAGMMSLFRRVSSWRSLFLGQDAMAFHFPDRCCIPVALLQHIYHASVLFHELRLLSCLAVVFLLCIAMPVFVSLTAFYGSYTHQYAWTYSAAFLSGQSAAIGLLVLFQVFVLLVGLLAWRAAATLQAIQPTMEADDLKADSTADVSSLGHRPVRYVLIVLLNIAVVMIANGSYVYLFSAVDQPYAILLSLLLAFFKLGWGNVIRFCIIKYLQPSHQRQDVVHVRNILFHSSLVLFNTIVVPCLATLVVDSNCFYYLFVTPPSVTSSYRYDKCLQFDEYGCGTGETMGNQMDFSYQPPFSYSYQCSSAVLSGYAYVFVFKYILIGLVFPACVLAVSLYADQRNTGNSDKKPPFVTAILPPLWNTDRQAPVVQSQRHWMWSKLSACVLTACGTNAACVFSSADIAVRLSMMIGTLLTFGAVLPYLAVIICVAICTSTYLNQLGLARMLEKCASDDSKKAMLEEVCMQCRELYHALRQAALPLPGLLVVFCACFIFDTEGDQEGALRGTYFMLAMLVAPAVIFILTWIATRQH